MADDKPKIIIDEDWKSQVEAEKEAAKNPDTDSLAAAKQEADGNGSQGESAEQMDSDPPMPPASFSMLISSLATEAMMALGQLPHPVSGEVSPRRNQAKYLIDTITMLHEKTKGNVAEEESTGVQELLHQLKMAFVQMPVGKSESK